MTCRDEILTCARLLVSQTGRNEFTIPDILDAMRDQGTRYKDSTIRTHIVSSRIGPANSRPSARKGSYLHGIRVSWNAI